VFGVGFLWARAGYAQTCHSSTQLDPAKLGLHMSIGIQAAGFRTQRYSGEYQGLSIDAGWEHRWVSTHVRLPTYRIVRNGLEGIGLGDLLLAIRVPLARTGDESLRGGLGLAATAPTGDAGQDLGMGHFMLMPELWLRWTGERAFVEVSAMYGRALASSGGSHHGGGPGPIVNPMNASEIEGALTGGYWLNERFRARVGAYGAVPVDAPAGIARAAVFVGTDLVWKWFSMGLEGHIPVAGNLFTGKLAMTMGARF